MRTGVIYEAPMRCSECREEFRPRERALRVPSSDGWAHPECCQTIEWISALHVYVTDRAAFEPVSSTPC